MNEKAYIIDAKRTSIGKYGGSFIGTSATELGTIVLKDLLERNQAIIRYIDEVIMGNTLSCGLGQNPARITSIKAGLNKKIPSYTINKVCGSGLKSIIIGAESIINGNANLIMAGGMENMSRCPYILENYRFGAKMGNQIIKDVMIYDGLFCSLIGEHMGMTAEYLAKKYKISRKEQEAYALDSHRKAVKAASLKKFKEEIVPVTVTNGKNKILIDKDEQPRKDTSLEILSKLNPVFKKEGTVTAGTASSLNDGAAGALVASGRFIKKHKISPMAKIISFASIALDPRYMGMGSYYAAKKCLSKATLKVSDIDLWEINEAFASQSIAVIKFLGVNPEKVNVNGGALALGHPIGASGARILTSLLYELKKQSKQYGIASLCIGGGQGIAILVENV